MRAAYVLMDVSDEAVGAIWMFLPRFAQHIVRSTLTNKREWTRETDPPLQGHIAVSV